MAGLTASYINNKLSAEGTTTKTKDLILEFLNTAPSAAAIAGIEPKEGPVFDDPEEGYGDQVRDYNIGIIAKKEMTALSDTLPEPTPISGWTRVLATDGEIRKEGDTLYILDEKGGDRTVEVVNYKLE